MMQPFREKLLAGMQARGYDEDFANRVYDQIQGFGEYGFPESHSASFALLVYASAWLKRHHPAEFTAALLNSQPLGFYAPAQLVAEARRQCVEVRPVDANASDWDCTLEAREGVFPALRLGFRMLSSLKRSTADRVVAVRAAAPFVTQAEFEQRTQLGQSEMSLLAKADVFRSLRTGRRTALWNALPAPDHSPLFAPLNGDEPSVTLPTMTAVQDVVADYQTTGLSLHGHPFQFLRAELKRCGVTPNSRLAHVEPDRRYRIAGLVLLRQRPSTAKGITFMTLEDETGTANLIVHVNTWERFRPVARGASALIAHGILQRQHGVCHLLVDRLDDLTDVLGAVTTRSRDFR